MTTRQVRGGRNISSRNPRDCGVRALTIAGNIPYQEALDRLAERGRIQGTRRGVTYASQIMAALDDLGIGHKKERGTGTLRTASKNYSSGTWILHTRDHFAAIHEGVVYDAFAGSLRRITAAWQII